MQEQCLKSAQEWLTYLRRGTGEYRSFLECFRREVRKGSLSLEKLGTSEEELECLRVLGCKTAAIQWLECIRRGTKQYESCLEYLRRELKAGGLSLADIDTSEEELARSAPKGEWGGYGDF